MLAVNLEQPTHSTTRVTLNLFFDAISNIFRGNTMLLFLKLRDNGLFHKF